VIFHDTSPGFKKEVIEEMAPPFPFSCPERIQKYFQLPAALCNGHFIPIRAFIEKITEYTATTRIRHEARLPQTVHRMIRERGVQSLQFSWSPGTRYVHVVHDRRLLHDVAASWD